MQLGVCSSGSCSCRRCYEHAFLPPVSGADEVQDAYGAVVCLSCLHERVSSIPLADLIDELRNVDELLDHFRDNTEVACGVDASVLSSLVLLTIRRVGRSTPADGRKGEGYHQQQPSQRTSFLPVVASLLSTLGNLIVSLAALLSTRDAAVVSAAAHDRPHKATSHRYAAPAGESFCGSLPVLGMSQAYSTVLPSPVAEPNSCERESQRPSTTLNTFASEVLAQYGQVLDEAQRSEAGLVTSLLTDVVERSNPFRSTLASDAALLSALVHRCCCGHSLFPELSCRAVEHYTYMLYLVFAEVARNPQYLEQLAIVISSAPQSTVLANHVATKGGLAVALAGGLDQHAGSHVLVSNALGLLHFLLSHATTAQSALLLNVSSKDSVQSASVVTVSERVLRSVTPLMLSAREGHVALACEVVRLVLQALRQAGADGAEQLAAVGWVEDYALEALQCVPHRAISALLTLLDEIALGEEAVAGDAVVAESNLGTSWAERLQRFRRVATFSGRAIEQAVAGPYLRRIVLKGRLPLDHIAEFVCTAYRTCEDDPNADKPSDGEAARMNYAAVVALAELFVAAAEDARTVAPEHVACISHAVAARFGNTGAVSAASAPPTLADGGASCGSTPLLLPSLSEELADNTLVALLDVVAFFLSVAPELLPVALRALTDVVTERPLPVSRNGRTATAALLSVATQLARGCFDEGVLPQAAVHQFALLAQSGLFDHLLSVSAGPQTVADPSVPRVADDMDALRVGLVCAVANSQLNMSSLAFLRGARSMVEVVQRLCNCPVMMEGDAAAAKCDRGRTALPVLGGQLLTTLASLGCAPPLPLEDLSAFALAAYRQLMATVVREWWNPEEERENPLEGLDGGGKGGTPGAAAWVGHVVRLCVVHFHWFRGVPSSTACADSSTCNWLDGSQGGPDFSWLCATPSTRRAVLASLVPRRSICGGAALPSLGDVIGAMLHHPWGFPLSVHLSLAAVIETLTTTERAEEGEDKFVGVACLMNDDETHMDLLVKAAQIDNGDCMLKTVFSIVQREQYHRDHYLAHCQRAWHLPTKLLQFLVQWLRAVIGGGAGQDERSNGEGAALCLLEQHCTPLVLSWGAAYPKQDNREGVNHVAEASLACEVTRLLVASLTCLSPTAGGGADSLLIRWYLRGVTKGWHDHCFLQLLCLLLERSHGYEVARRLGPTPLSLTVTEVTASTPISTVVLLGVIQHLTTSLSHNSGVSHWRQWSQLVPVSRLVVGCAQGFEGVAPVDMALVVRVCEYFFLCCSPTGSTRVKQFPLGVVTAPASIPDEEFHAVLCVLEWCTALALSSSTFPSPVPLPHAFQKGDESRLSRSAGRVIHFLLRAYRASVGLSAQVLSLFLLCARGGSLLSVSTTGWLLAGLLYVAPAMPWRSTASTLSTASTSSLGVSGAGKQEDSVAALARAFLATLDREHRQDGHGSVRDDEADEMLQALVSACEYYAAAVPGTTPFPFHRVKDFFSLSSVARNTEEACLPEVCHFLVHNDLNVRLTSL